MGKFSKIYEDVTKSSHSGMVAWASVNSKGLRDYLLNKNSDDILADPVFEATFPYVQSHLTMKDLPNSGILSTSLINVLHNADQDFKFPNERRPFVHQFLAWEWLRHPGKSAIISSGTGSGKTECFLFPIFDSLYRQMDECNTVDLCGVQALILYPLNALIKSQKKRLAAWSQNGRQRVRYCLYNRLLEERHNDLYGTEVKSRIALRNSPPPILLTNTSMLEYMLVRSEDSPILEQSKGKLRWIVLDEAHTYIGSKSADLALLLRRTLIAFGVSVQDVQFIATSATISGDGADDELRKFLADIGGVEPDDVNVVTSVRDFPNEHIGTLDDFTDPNIGIDSKKANFVRNAFLELHDKQPKGILSLSSLKKALDDRGVVFGSTAQYIDLIDQCCELKNADGSNFLPLRAHFFHRLMDGLWACANRQCEFRQAELRTDGADWHFGKLFDELRKVCSCGCLVYELAFCNECGSVVLESQLVHENGNSYYLPVARGDVSKYGFDLVEEVDQDEPDDVGSSQIVRLAGQQTENCNQIPMDLRTGQATVDANSYLFIAVQDHVDVNQCPNCSSIDKKGHLFKGFSIGAPYFISAMMPEILEKVDPLENGADCPLSGRRALCFNDSRSGTASLSLRGHSESERQFIRALSYHNAGEAQNPNNHPHIVEFRNALNLNQNDPATANALNNILQTFIANLPPFSYSDFATAVRTNVTSSYLKSYYHNLAVPPDWVNNDDNFAFVMFTREFGRRPLRANTLETLGLVSVVYLPLHMLVTVPRSIQNHFTLAQWKDYLHTVVDMTFRSVGAIYTRGFHYRELSLPTYGKSYCHVADDDINDTNRYNRWPQVRSISNPNRLVLITAVELGLGLDQQSLSAARNDIDLVLNEAWDVIRQSSLLTRDDNLPGPPEAYRLDLTKCGLVASDTYNLCPVTRKAVRPIRNRVTPYLRRGNIAQYQVTDFSLPVFHRDNGISVRNFLDSPSVSALRSHGVWSIFQDRVIADGPYFETVEHSAGVPKRILDNYEELFERGKVNVLNCSTTMEMGVDIAGVQAVVMNNVPPHPANYLQRTGRAGRRGEAQAIALTMCRTNPHELSVFANPLWPFVTKIAAPIVRMDSPSIVQRHVNAMFLQRFVSQMRQHPGNGANSLKSGGFFRSISDVNVGDEPPLIERFAAWLTNNNVANDFRNEFTYIVHGTCLAELSLQQVMNVAKEAVERIALNWINRWNELTEQVTELNIDASLARYAVQHDLDRHCNEDLMVYLTHKAWLPVHGFPTSIATFDTTNQNSSRHVAENRDLVSRDSSVALREYAPGCEIVQAGNVFMSAGLSMNWRLPATVQGIVESQNIYDIEVCQSCGIVSLSNDLDKCGCSCRSTTKRYKAIEPVGYAVDYSRNPLTVTHPHSKQFAQTTFITSLSEFTSFPNPKCGRVRISPEAKVYTVCQPREDKYFELCLGCGRMAGLPGLGQLDNVHLKLRSNTHCTVPLIWSEQKRLVLAATNSSSALELQLAKEGAFLSTNTLDTKITKTLGTALIHAMSDMLGVDKRELRFTCTKGSRASLVLFDEGASGHVSTFQQRDQFINLLKLAQKKLLCPANCESACSHCLVDFSNRWDTADLDRKAAIDWLSDDWIETFCQQPEIHDGLPVSDLSTEVLMRVRSGNTERVRVFGNISVRGGDLVSSSIPNLVTDLLKTGVQVDLIFDSSPQDMNVSDIRRLSSLLVTFSSLLKIGHYSLDPASENVLVEIHRSQPSCDRFVCVETSTCIVDETWGATGVSLQCNHPESFISDINVIWIPSFDTASHANHDLGMFYISGKRTTPERIAQTLVDKVLAEVPRLTSLLDRNQVVKIAYSDRYLRTPMSAAILVSIHKKLTTLTGDVVLQITSRPINHRETGSKFEFISEAERETYLNQLWEATDLKYELALSQGTKHERYLLLETTDGHKVTILIDCGLSFWDYVASESEFMRADKKPTKDTWESTELSSRFEENEMPVVIRMTLPG
jgi:DEAD/DEAH box helicase domain-containing protein